MTAFESLIKSNQNESGISNDIYSNLPLDSRFNELRSLAPVADEHKAALDAMLPKFEDVFDKFDYDQDGGLSKDEVARAATDESFQPQEQQMAQFLSKDYDTIKPMGGIFIAETDGLSKDDLEALDGLAKDGISYELAFDYGNTIASGYLWRSAQISVGSWAAASLMPHPVAKAVVGLGGFVASLGYGLYGIGKGVSDYYSAKPELERIRKEIRNMPYGDTPPAS